MTENADLLVVELVTAVRERSGDRDATDALTVAVTDLFALPHAALVDVACSAAIYLDVAFTVIERETGTPYDDLVGQMVTHALAKGGAA